MNGVSKLKQSPFNSEIAVAVTDPCWQYPVKDSKDK